MASYLWGDNFWDEESQKFVKEDKNEKTGKKLKRGFVKFVIEPILEMFNLIEEKNYKTAAEKLV